MKTRHSFSFLLYSLKNTLFRPLTEAEPRIENYLHTLAATLFPSYNALYTAPKAPSPSFDERAISSTNLLSSILNCSPTSSMTTSGAICLMSTSNLVFGHITYSSAVDWDMDSKEKA